MFDDDQPLTLLFGIFVVLFGLFVQYLIIKAAVRNGVIEAQGEKYATTSSVLRRRRRPATEQTPEAVGSHARR